MKMILPWPIRPRVSGYFCSLFAVYCLVCSSVIYIPVHSCAKKAVEMNANEKTLKVADNVSDEKMSRSRLGSTTSLSSN